MTNRPFPMEGAPSLRVERGETIVLSPDSERFREVYRQVRPRTADEVRKYVGLSAESVKALIELGTSRQLSSAETFSETVASEELESRDDVVRSRAWDIACRALSAYVYSVNPKHLASMVHVIDDYLRISDAVLHIAVLNDIEVLPGATLPIGNTSLVTANRLIVHKTGRIACSGAVKFVVASVEGRP